MKQYINIMMAAAGLLLSTSCSNKLDILPEGAPSKSSFWRTSEDAVKGANALYANYDEEEFYGRGFFWFINASDDMVTGRNNAQAENVRNFSSTYIGGGYTEPQWKFRYMIIKRANDILRYVPTIEMDADLKRRILGEANFNAGYMYFQLAANYADSRAGVPIVTVENMDNEKATPRAASVDENYQHIEKLLKNAANQLPYFQDLDAEDFGRAHKVAAWAVLSKMYLYKKDYKNAILYADSVINNGKNRGLQPEFADVFKAANNYGSEYIWSATSTPAGKDGWGSILPGVMLTNGAWGLYNGWGYYMPTKELYDSYEAGDVRREATILKPGDKFRFFGEERTFAPAASATCDLQFNKYMEPFSYSNPVGTHVSPNGDHMATDLNVPLLRFAEILLIKVEAAIMLNGAGAGDKELNLIRQRAKLSMKTGMTLTDLKRERRNELAGEFADRHRDLVRWGDAQATYAKPVHAYALKDQTTGKLKEFPGRKFDPKIHHVWAVPQQEIDNSQGIIKQNEGW